jgi:chromosome segregation ATPase
LLLEAQDLIS